MLNLLYGATFNFCVMTFQSAKIALDQYLERLPVSIELLHTSVLDLGRKFDVPPYLSSDAVRAIK